MTVQQIKELEKRIHLLESELQVKDKIIATMQDTVNKEVQHSDNLIMTVALYKQQLKTERDLNADLKKQLGLETRGRPTKQ